VTQAELTPEVDQGRARQLRGRAAGRSGEGADGFGFLRGCRRPTSWWGSRLSHQIAMVPRQVRRKSCHISWGAQSGRLGLGRQEDLWRRASRRGGVRRGDHLWLEGSHPVCAEWRLAGLAEQLKPPGSPVTQCRDLRVAHRVGGFTNSGFGHRQPDPWLQEPKEVPPRPSGSDRWSRGVEWTG
jgi:hypothetical protein